MPPEEPASQSKLKQKKTFYKTYGLAYVTHNFFLFLGQPAERFKVAAQINLHIFQLDIFKPIAEGGLPNLFRGFWPTVMRQNVAFFQRTFIITTIPKWIDGYNFNVTVSSGLKGFVATAMSTLTEGPFDTVKTRQMKTGSSVLGAIRSVYQENGIRGFFAGANVNMTKSFPGWFYLFLSYQAIEGKREKQNFLSTLLWATTMSFPLVLVTAPAEVIKSQRQAGFVPKGESSFKFAKHLVTNYGWPCLWRGMPFRLLQKALGTSIDYAVMDAMKSGTENEDHSCSFKPG